MTNRKDKREFITNSVIASIITFIGIMAIAVAIEDLTLLRKPK